MAASLSQRAISVNSLSKSYGVPGIRIGWLVTTDPELMHTFISAKEQMGITGSVVDEEIARQILARREQLLPEISAEVQQKYAVFSAWAEKQPQLEWARPAGGVVVFVRIPGANDDQMTYFYDQLREKYRIAVGPGYWFKMPLNMFRIGFGWNSVENTAKGLERLGTAMGECF